MSTYWAYNMNPVLATLGLLSVYDDDENNSAHASNQDCCLLQQSECWKGGTDGRTDGEKVFLGRTDGRTTIGGVSLSASISIAGCA